MRVLVTGGSGFIGRQCVAQLTARGHEVHVFSFEPRRSAEDPGQWHVGDFFAPGMARQLIDDVAPEAILHLAWCTEHGEYWNSPRNLDWVRISIELLQRFADAGGRRFVGAGTCAEYDWSYGHLNETDTPTTPATLYGSCKGAFRDVLAAYAADANFSQSWGRVFFLYGPGESPGRLVPSIIVPLLQGQPARCTDGAQVRDFLSVDDVAGAFVALVESEVTGAVNIASGHPVSVAEIADTIGALIGRPDLIQRGALPPRPDDPAVLVGTSTRLTSEVGFSPRDTVTSGLLRTIDWWRSQGGVTR
jgi:nucleoside-diphosphate-sugar epimerase